MQASGKIYNSQEGVARLYTIRETNLKRNPRYETHELTKYIEISLNTNTHASKRDFSQKLQVPIEIRATAGRSRIEFRSVPILIEVAFLYF